MSQEIQSLSSDPLGELDARIDAVERQIMNLRRELGPAEAHPNPATGSSAEQLLQLETEIDVLFVRRAKLLRSLRRRQTR